MNRIKALIIICLVSIILLVINACCDEGFSYKWHNIILQNYANSELATENTIKQNEFSLRVHLISSKYYEAGIYIPKLINYTYANNCMGKYLNMDMVSDVDIVFLNDKNGTQTPEIVTFQFKAKTNINPGDMVTVLDLPSLLNRENSEPVEYFDLLLNEPFEQDITGRFIVAVNLADKRSLSDTTETLNLRL